jgi:two-component system response regulator PilR (NtrC family)
MSAPILVVDDDPTNLELISLALVGFQVVTFTRPSDAVAFAARQTPALVLTDYRMPEGNGVGLLRELADLKINCPAILVTGYDEVDEVQHAKDDGLAFEVVTKPWRPAELLKQVKEVLKAHEAAKQA